ncbi:MAG: hypothetical protein Kow0074_20880 [Candidatus Zixiibacteriota bacterium]
MTSPARNVTTLNHGIRDAVRVGRSGQAGIGAGISRTTVLVDEWLIDALCLS